MKTFEHDGWRFSVLDHGDRDAVPYILLHGFPGDAPSWDGVATRLAAEGFRVLAPDQRGYAAEARPSAVRAYAVSELAADVLALADQAGADQFHLAGHDWAERSRGTSPPITPSDCSAWRSCPHRTRVR